MTAFRCILGGLLVLASSVWGAVVPIPNASFETPVTDSVDPQLDSWRKIPKPDSFEESPEQQWDQLVQIFRNAAPGSTNHIVNIHGNQALYLFSVPEAGILQDLHASFEPGSSYRLDVGLIGGGGSMPEGASIMVGLYYRDDDSNIVHVAARSILHSTNLFPDTTNLVDVTMILPTVSTNDSWAGRNIGVIFLSTATAETATGYWHLDNVRLTAIRPQGSDTTLRVERIGSDVRISWLSESGKNYRLEQSEDLNPWTQVSDKSGNGGELFEVLPLSEASHAFFRLVIQ